MTEQDILETGLMLEEKGLSHAQIDAYLEHHGVKGMKWGQRRQQKNTAKFQKRNVDVVKRVAAGKGSKMDKFRVGAGIVPAYRLLQPGGIQKGAKKNIEQRKKIQKKVKAGKGKTMDILNKAYGINIADLKY